MSKKVLFFIWVGVLAGLNLASIRKAEDPIRDTQTNPILYKQKMEEEKDGKKGPLLYNVKNNPHDTFFVDLPYEADTKTPPGKTATEKVAAPEETAGWWEEQPGESRAASPGEPATKSLPEPSTEEKALPRHESADPSAVTTDTGNTPTATTQGDDYWW